MPRTAPSIVVSVVDDVDTEEIYIRLEIFPDTPRQDLWPLWQNAHMRAAHFMSFDFHKLSSATWMNAIA